MSARARIAHHVPGRLRLRLGIGKHKQKRDVLHAVKESLSAMHGVRHLDVHPGTNSVVVHYRGRNPADFERAVFDHSESSNSYDLSPPEIGAAGEAWRLIEREAEFLAPHSELARSVVQETKKLDSAVQRATDNAVDLKVIIPLGLAVFSMAYLGSDVATPLWISLGVFSFNSFVSLHPPLPYPDTKNQRQRSTPQ